MQALDTFNTAVVSPIYYVMFTSLTIVASVIMFKVIIVLVRSFWNPFIGGYDDVLDIIGYGFETFKYPTLPNSMDYTVFPVTLQYTSTENW